MRNYNESYEDVYFNMGEAYENNDMYTYMNYLEFLERRRIEYLESKGC